MTQISDPTAARVTCPHCSAPNRAGAAFCESCGKALPTAAPSTPRIVTDAQFATTGAGQKLQADELHKTAKKAAGALLAVAIIQTIICAILLAVASANNRVAALMDSALAVSLIGIAVVFWALYIWARRQPLPAAIVGLVLYATLITVNVIVSIGQMSETGQRGTGFGGIGIGWLDIVILIVLGKAISAGVKHRKLMGQQTAVPSAV
jgi:hypothetical protein